MSLVRIPEPVNRKLGDFRRSGGSAGWERERHGRVERIETRLLILAEELLSVFDEADDHYDRGASHAHEEQDLQDVHCEQSDLEHENDCNPDGRKFPCLNFVRIERSGSIQSHAAGKLLCVFEIETDCGLYALGVGSGLIAKGCTAALC